MPIHWRGALLEGSTRSQPRQRPFSGRRRRLGQKKRHGNRKDTTILHWTPLGLALSCAGERMARDSHRHNACVRSCVFQSSHGIFRLSRRLLVVLQ